jgi:hypothetical protein
MSQTRFASQETPLHAQRPPSPPNGPHVIDEQAEGSSICVSHVDSSSELLVELEVKFLLVRIQW